MDPPGDAPSLPQKGEKLDRLAAIAEAVSKQKGIPLSMSVDNSNNRSHLQQYDLPTSIVDTIRRKNTPFMASTVTQNDVESSAAAVPPPGFNLPSTVASMLQVRGQSQNLHKHQISSSSFSRKRPRGAEYTLDSNKDQRGYLSMVGFESQTMQQQQPQPYYHQQQQQNQQSHQYQYQNQSEELFTSSSRIGSMTSVPQPHVDEVRFREYQAEIWSEKLEELCAFRRYHGHCHVPHHHNQNTGLAQWVKRQRYQYKLKLDNKRSTLSDERVRLLNRISFIWNSHDAVWEERLQDLIAYKRANGHCIVPSNFESNPQLAVWTKRQRRQYKKYQDGTSSSMTPERIAKLEDIGFVWDCRKINKADDIRSHVEGVEGIGAARLAHRLNVTGVTSGGVIGNHLQNAKIDMNTSTVIKHITAVPLISQQVGQALPNFLSRWNDYSSSVPISRGGDQRSGAYNNEPNFTRKASDMSIINEYSSSLGSRRTSMEPSLVGSHDVRNHESDANNINQKLSSSPSSSINGPTLLGKQQPIRKAPKCEFFSFSRKYSRDDEK